MSSGYINTRGTAVVIALLLFTALPALAGRLLIPMDFSQTDHLKAYGITYEALKRGFQGEWLLNYRGGSFLLPEAAELADLCKLRGVSYEMISGAQTAEIYQTIEENNMETVKLERAPSLAVYSPPNKLPWDDAVTLAMTYAEIPYTVVWDKEILSGDLAKYDWLHLHHEDFTGQYGKFYGSYRSQLWYQQDVALNQTMARALGFSKVSKMKLAVAEIMRDYVLSGGFMFAMCSATDTYDISLAAHNTDICEPEYDGDAIDPDAQAKLDFAPCFAFQDFKLVTSPFIYEFSDIDVTQDLAARIGSPEADYFTLFDFSAKIDPVPSMLVQDHVNAVNGFMGQTTAFRKDLVKKYVIILGEMEGKGIVKYIHGNIGKGTFTWLGGHDPEDYQHLVGDPPTDLSLHKNSPGYRLILNNVLFPAAQKKERKT